MAGGVMISDFKHVYGVIGKPLGWKRGSCMFILYTMALSEQRKP